MFSGIIECTSKALDVLEIKSEELCRVKLARPPQFQDLKVGDSVAVNGVCLTVESFDGSSIQFAIGKETLNVTGWTKAFLSESEFNLERSLKFEDRIHGHLVTGHVDFLGKVKKLKKSTEGLEVWLEFPKDKKDFFWAKGSVCLNGVSLTINEVEDSALRVNLVPETLKVTNLKSLSEGQSINVEIDNFARGMIHYFKGREPHGTSLG